MAVVYIMYTNTFTVYYRAYTHEPTHNNGYRIIPITIQLRPTPRSWSWGFLDEYHSFSSPESSNLRYLLPQNEVSMHVCKPSVLCSIAVQWFISTMQYISLKRDRETRDTTSEICTVCMYTTQPPFVIGLFVNFMTEIS